MSGTGGTMENFNKTYNSFKNALSCVRQGQTPTSQEEQEYLKRLNAENLALTQQLMQTRLELEKAKKDNLTLKSQHETKEALFEEDKRFLVEEIKFLKAKINGNHEDMEKVKEEISELRRESEAKDVLLKEERESKEALKNEVYEHQQGIRILKKDLEGGQQEISQNQSSGALSGVFIKEVDSLNGVLGMKHNEIKSLQRTLTDAKENEIALELLMRKMRRLKAECKYMHDQLKRTTESERDLKVEIDKLENSILEENSQNRRLSCQNRRLSCQNEELHRKLKQSKSDESDGASSSNFAPPIPPKIRKIVQKRNFVVDLGDICEQGVEIEIFNGAMGK